MSPIPDQDDPSKQPASTAANTSGGAMADPSRNPRQVDRDAVQGVPGTSTETVNRAATGVVGSAGPGQPNFSGPSAGTESDAQRTARHQEEDAKAANKQARRKSHMQGLAEAHDNLGKEIDALVAQLSQGNPVTSQQLQALRSSIKGVHATAHGIADGSLDAQAEQAQTQGQAPGSAPGSAGTQNR